MSGTRKMARPPPSKSVLREGVLVRFKSSGECTIRDENNKYLVVHRNNFLQKHEATADCVGRRCRYNLQTGHGVNVVTDLRLITGPGGTKKRTDTTKVERPGEGNGDTVSAGDRKSAKGDEDCSWELVTNKSKRKSKSSPDKPSQSSELNSLLSGYRFLGLITSYNSTSKSGTISSDQVEQTSIRFGAEPAMSILNQCPNISGKRIFFYLTFNSSLQVTKMTFAAGYMTPQKVSGHISSWDGKQSTMQLQHLKVPILLDPAEVSSGNPLGCAVLNMKLNCSLYLDVDLRINARDVALYTNSFKPRGSKKSLKFPDHQTIQQAECSEGFEAQLGEGGTEFSYDNLATNTMVYKENLESTKQMRAVNIDSKRSFPDLGVSRCPPTMLPSAFSPLTFCQSNQDSNCDSSHESEALLQADIDLGPIQSADSVGPGGRHPLYRRKSSLCIATEPTENVEAPVPPVVYHGAVEAFGGLQPQVACVVRQSSPLPNGSVLGPTALNRLRPPLLLLQTQQSLLQPGEVHCPGALLQTPDIVHCPAPASLQQLSNFAPSAAPQFRLYTSDSSMPEAGPDFPSLPEMTPRAQRPAAPSFASRATTSSVKSAQMKESVPKTAPRVKVIKEASYSAKSRSVSPKNAEKRMSSMSLHPKKSRTISSSGDVNQKIARRHSQERKETSGGMSFAEDSYTPTPETKHMLKIKGLDFEEEDLTKDLAEQIALCKEETDLNELFQSLRPRFSQLLTDAAGCKALAKFIRKISQIPKSSSALEKKIARVVQTSFMTLIESKDGCLIIQTCLAHFQDEESKQILAELTVDLDSDDLARFWISGLPAFKLAIECLDEQGVTALCENISGNYTKLSCQVKQYSGMRELLKRARNFAVMDDIIDEIKEDFLYLSKDRFGGKVVTTILEIGTPNTIGKVVAKLLGHLEELAVHPVASSVLETALKFAASDVQDLIIGELCTEKSKDADSTLVNLSRHKDGHKVIITMLEEARGRSTLQELKSSLLFKQEMLYSNEFASKVLFYTRLV